MKKLQILVLAGLLIANVGLAAGSSRITLSDGTTIYGKVVGMNDGVYTIRTETMGDLNIDSEKVVEISSNAAKASSRNNSINILDGSANRKNNSYSGNNNSYTQQQQNVNTRVQSMMMDENFLQNLSTLGSSPEMQSVMNDEEIMNAIQNGDYEFLMNSSKISDLMNSSEIQDLLGDM